MTITCFIVEPAKRETRAFECDSVNDAITEAGLERGHIDFGMISRDADSGDGIEMVVYEFGLFDPPKRQHYFTIDQRLVAGNAVLFGFDMMGESRSISRHELPDISYLNGEAEIEAAIRAGHVRRPAMRLNGQLLWQWPQPSPLHTYKSG